MMPAAGQDGGHVSGAASSRKRGAVAAKCRHFKSRRRELAGVLGHFAGRRQEKMLSNLSARRGFFQPLPTLMQEARKQLRLGFDGVSLIASWGPLCTIAFQPPLIPTTISIEAVLLR